MVVLKNERIAGFNWYMQRITGVLLAIWLIVHFLVIHFSHLRATGKQINFNWVHQRLQSGWWQAFYGIFGVLVIYHGLYGIYNIFADYDMKPGTRKALVWTLWIIGIAAVVFGWMALSPFIHGTHGGV